MRLRNSIVQLLVVAICGWSLVGAAGASAARDDGGQVRLDGAPTAVAFSPDSDLVATALNWSHTVAVFATAGGSPVPVPGSPFHTAQEPVSVSFSPGGNLLAVASDRAGEVTVYRVAANGSLKRAPESPVEGLSGAKQAVFTPDGKALAVLSAGGTLSFFAVGGDGKLTELSGSPLPGAGRQAIAISPDGKLLATAGGDELAVYGFSTFGGTVRLKPLSGTPLHTGADQAGSMTFNPTGSLIAVANAKPRSVSMYAVLTDVGAPGKIEGSPFDNRGDREPDLGGNPSSVAFSPDGRQLAATNFGWPELEPIYSSATFFSVGEGFYTFGRLTKQETFPLDATLGPALESAVAFSPDGRLFASTTAYRASTTGSLALWPTSTLPRPPKGKGSHHK